mgnify:CR=1 FL=1
MKYVILKTLITTDMKDIFPIRLKNARKMRGMSLRKLSEEMNGEVSANALAKYEKGEIFPSSKVMIKLASSLGLRIDDFFRPITISIELEKIKYRKQASLGKKEIEAINYFASSELEKYIEVENMTGESRNFTINYFDTPVKDDNDALSIAARFRQDFCLGDSPITTPIELLETSGVKIIEVDACRKFDGNSFTFDNIFVIVLNRNFIPERKRLSLFHEIGHKVMKFAEGVDEERLCNIFANEVLLPTEVFIEKIGKIRKNISLIELKDIQCQFGISVEAMMVKARQANIISQNRYTSFYKRKNFSKQFKENVEKSVFQDEHCKRFERLVFKLLANEIITESKCASLLGCSVHEVRENLNLV